MAFHKSSNEISCRIIEKQTLLDVFKCHCIYSFHLPFSFGIRAKFCSVTVWEFYYIWTMKMIRIICHHPVKMKLN
jgi:hypothetical protein